jgi:hypothetical protein
MVASATDGCLSARHGIGGIMGFEAAVHRLYDVCINDRQLEEAERVVGEVITEWYSSMGEVQQSDFVYQVNDVRARIRSSEMKRATEVMQLRRTVKTYRMIGDALLMIAAAVIGFSAGHFF